MSQGEPWRLMSTMVAVCGGALTLVGALYDGWW